MVASELYDICLQLASNPPSAIATHRLHEVLVLVCAEGSRKQGGAFGNLFSQVDFLGKQLGLSIAQTIDLQTARRHTNTGAPISNEDWPYDVMAVVRLISAVFLEDVPGVLLQRLPADRRPHAKGLQVNKKYIRCVVNTIDDTVATADTDENVITIDYRNTDNGRDFGYLHKLLRPGMQINLLDCNISKHGDEMVVVPGQVIVEPDFLIDISSLATCFTNYGHHPLLYTLNRLKPRANSRYLLLGNFAGTALDDIVNRGEEATTAQALQRSFREQALQFCACPDFNAHEFKTQAEVQMNNIREAIDILRTNGDSHTTYLLEPSFVCERLGLQGRVDLMTADMSLLVEQKAGRNGKIEYGSHDSHGLQLENHYVQLLLYYGVLRYNFDKSDRQVDTRLLYSRYPAARGLLTVNYYHALLREALQLRNQIVATELYIAREGFQRVLPLLCESIIYKDVTRDAYFHQYILPDLQSLTHHLGQITPLERAYYERMLTFVYREQVASKLGSAETRLHHSKGCTADLWQMPLQEKQESGNIMMGLQLAENDGDRIVRLTYIHDDANSGVADSMPISAPNFRQGDMVYLYSYKDEPDVCRSILYKGTLLEIEAHQIAVQLNDAQHDPHVFCAGDGRKWAVEHGSSDTNTGAAIRAMQYFITAAPRRRNLLLGQRTPEAEESRCLSHSYHPDYDEVLEKVRKACDYFLLVGPPGTGKTSMALRFIVEEALLADRDHPHPNLLLMAYTNRAVDEICGTLCDAGKPFLRLGKEASCAHRYHPFLLETVLADKGKLDDARQLIDSTPIIVATTSMLQTQPWLLELKQFSMAVVDEASQILEPSLIGILSHPSIDRFVLIGDHKQLPAVVQQSPEQSAVTEQCLRDICLDNCSQSLFERLLRWEHRQGRTQFVGTLHSHGRMHPEVAQFPIQHFYQREQLSAVPLPHQREASLGYDLPARDELDEQLKTHRLLFLPSPYSGQPEEAEAQLVADILKRIYRYHANHFEAARTVGVIVPYRRQIAYIRQYLNDDNRLKDITIDTVERYQGSQRDVIVYSFAISHRYQLDFLTATTFVDDDGTLVDRKLNVALTRARKQMIIIGRPDLLRNVPLFSQLMEAYR
ncbi:MAG: ATP-binding protein [Prevotella sp.]|nr:ATP-binding protein [Prevotella sp.]